MGHTHYNEISHDGRTIYTATRSTGEIEEGRVGFSVTNLDHGVVSWRFLELDQLPAVIITSPVDEQLMPDDAERADSARSIVRVSAKIWGASEQVEVRASLAKITAWRQEAPESLVWEAMIPCEDISAGIQPLRVDAVDAQRKTGSDEIRALFGQENALEAWTEHGLLGTQLGPDKNGRKW